MTIKNVYHFGGGEAEGSAGMKELLGGKGANLAEMATLGIPVPAGFTITTDVCTHYVENDKTYPETVQAEVSAAIKHMEEVMGRRFGDPEKPLLLSVRSGARASMPGMMDTVLNLGINDEIVRGLEAANPRAAWDCYRRFVQMYGDVVMDLKPVLKTEVDPFEAIIEDVKRERGISEDVDLRVVELKGLVQRFKALIKARTGKSFPDDPHEQLWGAISAVFGSWQNDRAKVYRRINKIPEHWGTAVNVQAMVFGNMGDDCATGVGFSRNPANGAKGLYGEYLVNAQGEDVVAGTRTPQPLSELRDAMPALYKQLDDIVRNLEDHYRDMQDIEFTIEHDHLWMLQTRNGKRTGFAACQIAVDLVAEGKVEPADALTRLIPDANALDQLLKPVFDPESINTAKTEGRLMAKGLAAGPGAAAGKIAFNAEDAVAMAAKGDPVVLVRVETSPEDIRGMEASQGILTARGGQTSHAALVARQMGKVCIAGCADLVVDYSRGKLTAGGMTVRAGDYLSIDGFTGEVFTDRVRVMPSQVKQALFGSGEVAEQARQSHTFMAFQRLLEWADQYRTLGVRSNADQPDQAAEALVYGAEGIGLCRTEHMFFGGDRIMAVREMIVANDSLGREQALEKLLPYQRDDFTALFKAMGTRPVTVRLLDPPLHEFLPHSTVDIMHLAKSMHVDTDVLNKKLRSLHEFNPMLGHRGCRLGITYPEIYMMQVRAIVEAAIHVRKYDGIDCKPEIMIPLVGHRKELAILRHQAEDLIANIMAAEGVEFTVPIGTMIELPRAALTADAIATDADFFSFGTNDLTQTVFGLSRDDSGRFLPDYVEKGILPDDPFVSIDLEGVGALVEIGTQRGRKSNPALKVGICGEHGGDPQSVHFFHQAGLNYISCSPSRLPVARLAAAQAAILYPQDEGEGQ